MMHLNNLGDHTEPKAFEVTTPFEVFDEVGCFLANTYVGRSRACGAVYRVVTLPVGTVVIDHRYHTFVQVPGSPSAKAMVPQLSCKHLFESPSGVGKHWWPMKLMREIQMPNPVPPLDSGRNPGEVTTASAPPEGSRAAGRSDDRVIDGAECSEHWDLLYPNRQMMTLRRIRDIS
jgi:hypothetical protein